jgi:hypothetical protein
MTEQLPEQPALNGFEALPKAEKQWFLIRVQSLSYAPAKERRVTDIRSIA